MGLRTFSLRKIVSGLSKLGIAPLSRPAVFPLRERGRQACFLGSPQEPLCFQVELKVPPFDYPVPGELFLEQLIVLPHR